MNEQKANGSKFSKTNLALAIIGLGSICGLIEVILSGFLKQIEFPFKSGLLVGLGFAVIAVGMAIFKKPVIAIFIGLIAVLSKQLAIAILGLPVMCMANSNLAVLLEYGALSGMAVFTIGSMKKSINMRMVTGGTAAALSSVAFYFIGMHVAPCNYLLSFSGAGGFVSFFLKESLSWTAAAVVLFPLGWFAGERIGVKAPQLVSDTKPLFYTATILAAVICWVSNTIAIARGF